MILRFTFEELSALRAGGEHVLTAEGASWVVAAPPEAVADVEALLPRLAGDISLHTLDEQRAVVRAVDYILEHLNQRMDEFILLQHVGSEDAVNAYFDYAHVLTVRGRVRQIGVEMAAIIEVVTGRSPDEDELARMTFPD